jgi:hypothetical protein
MPEISNARRPRRRLAYLIAPLVLAGSIAIGGVAEAASGHHAGGGAPAVTSAATSAVQVPLYPPPPPPPPPPGKWCSSVPGWSSTIFSSKGSEFWNHPGCNSLGITWVGKTGWYQGFYKPMGPWGAWQPCGKPMNLWNHSGWALLCKWVPPCSKMRVLSLQGQIVPITVQV